MNRVLHMLGALYVAQAATGAVIGFTVPWLHYFGWLS